MSEDLFPFLSHFYNDLLLGPELKPGVPATSSILTGLWNLSFVFVVHEPVKCYIWLLSLSVISSIIVVCPWWIYGPIFWVYLVFPFVFFYLGLAIPLYLRVLRRRQWQPTPVHLPGKSHGRRSLVGCSPWGHEESDTYWATSLSLSCIGEGNGNLLQCSCLENPRDGRAWWAAICGVAQSRTRLKWLSSSSKSS